MSRFEHDAERALDSTAEKIAREYLVNSIEPSAKAWLTIMNRARGNVPARIGTAFGLGTSISWSDVALGMEKRIAEANEVQAGAQNALNADIARARQADLHARPVDFVPGVGA